MVTLLNNDQLPKLNSNDSFKHAWELANALIRPQFKYRMERCNGFQSVTQASIREMLGINVVKITQNLWSQKKMPNMLISNKWRGRKEKKDSPCKTVHYCEKSLNFFRKRFQAVEHKHFFKNGFRWGLKLSMLEAFYISKEAVYWLCYWQNSYFIWLVSINELFSPFCRKFCQKLFDFFE